MCTTNPRNPIDRSSKHTSTPNAVVGFFLRVPLSVSQSVNPICRKKKQSRYPSMISTEVPSFWGSLFPATANCPGTNTVVLLACSVPSKRRALGAHFGHKQTDGQPPDIVNLRAES
ncbi:hypothetical protein ACOMHN_052041 [Nucella lapillus]